MQELGGRDSVNTFCRLGVGRRGSASNHVNWSREFRDSTAETGLTARNNNFTEVCSGSEAGSYLRLIDVCIAQL